MWSVNRTWLVNWPFRKPVAKYCVPVRYGFTSGVIVHLIKNNKLLRCISNFL
jgi:hypothetical protein